MTVAWTWWVFPGVVAGALVVALAVVVYRAGPPRRGRILALFLFLWGSQTVLNALPHLWPEFGQTWLAMDAVFWSTLAASLAAYLWFVSTLDSPFTRAVQGGAAVVYGTIVTVALIAMVRDETNFVARGPGSRALSALVGIVILYGLVVAAGAWWRARHRLARKQARSYFLAAAGHDALLIPMAIWFGVGSPGATFDQETAVVLTVPPVAALWLAVFLAYGILRFQLFDIDLRIKWTIRRSTLVAVFVAFFFVVSELAAALLSERVGTVLGILSAGALLFALAPLQRFAERVSDAAMPHVQDTDAYRTVRKREVYRAAVESALLDGAVTERERDVLATLATQLALTPEEMRIIEREAAAAGVSGG